LSERHCISRQKRESKFKREKGTKGGCGSSLRASVKATMAIKTLIYCDKPTTSNSEMKYQMSRELRFWVLAEYESTKSRLPNLSRSEIIAGLLGQLQNQGYAVRYLRKDGQFGWRATDEMREDLFKREQKVIFDRID
jgi:hypothetical protein